MTRLHGVLGLDKPEGQTSSRVLGRARAILGQKKAGHTGTLDPIATGVLVACFGEATKLVPYLQDLSKTYEVEARLGVVTDTDDREGEVLEERDPAGIERPAVETALAGYLGRIKQVPPAYSAVKIAGKRAYDLARSGQRPQLPEREVEVYAIDLLGFSPPVVRFSCTCSKGTYIRSIVRSLGEQLGVGAHVTYLRRTASGPFEASSCLTLDRLEELEGVLREHLLAPVDAVAHFPLIELSEDETRLVRQGRRPTPVAERFGGKAGPCRLVHLDEGFADLVAIARVEPDGRLVLHRVFADLREER